MRTTPASDVRLPGIHALLWVDEGRAIHREAHDAERETHPQVELASPRRVASHARPTGRTPTPVSQPAAAALRAPLHAAQPACALRLPTGAAKNLVPLSVTSQSPAGSVDHSFLRSATHMTRSTFGKIRVRESRMFGSVRAEPNGLATRPLPTSRWSPIGRRARWPGSAFQWPRALP